MAGQVEVTSADVRGGRDQVLQVEVRQDEKEENHDGEGSVQVIDERVLVWHHQHVNQEGKSQESHSWILQLQHSEQDDTCLT